MRGRVNSVRARGAKSVVEGFLFWPRCLYTDATLRQRQWRWLERAGIMCVVVGRGHQAYWRELYWIEEA